MFVIQKAGVSFSDVTPAIDAVNPLLGYTFSSNQEGSTEIISSKEDSSVAISPLILEAMKQFPHLPALQQEAVVVISTLTKSYSDCSVVGKFFGLELIMKAMRTFMDDIKLQTAGAAVLWRMCSLIEDFFEKVEKGGGVAMVLSCMRRRPHESHRRAVFNFIRLLKVLTRGHHEATVTQATADGLFSDQRNDDAKGQADSPHVNMRTENLEKMFPRVSKKRERLLLEERKAEEARANAKGKHASSNNGKLPALVPRPKKKNKQTAGGKPSKRRSILLIGVEDKGDAAAAAAGAAVAGGGTDGDGAQHQNERRGKRDGKGNEKFDDATSAAQQGMDEGGLASSSQRSLSTTMSTVKEREAEEITIVADGRSVMKTLLITLRYCIAQLSTEHERKQQEAEMEKLQSRQKRISKLLSTDPSSSSPTMVAKYSTKSLHKVSSMPMIASKPKYFGKEDENSEGGTEDEDDGSDDSDYGEDSIENYNDGDGLSLSGGKRKKRRKAKQEEPCEDEEEVIGPNKFKNQSYLITARDCLVNCVMAMDADDDGGCQAVMAYKSAQKIIIEGIEACKADEEAVMAGCMLIRGSLKSAARDRMKQTAFFIDCGLTDATNDIIEIHGKAPGNVMVECNTLVEELGSQFQRTLKV